VSFWEVLDYPCGKRLKRFLETIMAKVRQFKEMRVPRKIEAKLERISAPTIDRLL